MTINKPFYWIAGLFALLYWREHNGAAHSGVTRTEEATGAHQEGSEFLPDLWGMINGHGVSSQNYANPLPGSPTADAGGQAAALLNLLPAWDGSIQ